MGTLKDLGPLYTRILKDTREVLNNDLKDIRLSINVNF